MRTIYVSPEFPLNRRMRKAVQRGKLQVVRMRGRLFLHARRLAFRHPGTEEVVSVESPPPPEFAELEKFFLENDPRS